MNTSIKDLIVTLYEIYNNGQYRIKDSIMNIEYTTPSFIAIVYVGIGNVTFGDIKDLKFVEEHEHVINMLYIKSQLEDKEIHLYTHELKQWSINKDTLIITKNNNKKFKMKLKEAN